MLYAYMGATGILLCFYIVYIRNKIIELGHHPITEYSEKINCSGFLEDCYSFLYIPFPIIYSLFFLAAIIIDYRRFAHNLFYVFIPLGVISIIQLFRMIRKRSYCPVFILILMQTAVIWLGSLLWEII